MMIKVTDYIAKRLYEHGIKDIFMISGGGAMHLNDSLGNYPGLKYWTNHHEQACAIAAEGYYRASGNMAVVNVTTGPGGLNCLTGVLGQWTDSVPVLYISGQVKYETTTYSCKELGLRQLGDQEVDIISVVKPLTKYSTVLKNPYDVKTVIDRAIFIANEGRKGPVWIDVPMDVQGALIDETKLGDFDSSANMSAPDNDYIIQKANNVFKLLLNSKRPVIIAGHGIRLSGGQLAFRELIRSLDIPVVTTFNGVDLISSNHPNYTGRVGTLGNRSGNFTLQNADLIICLGSRNNIRQASYNWQNFGNRAVKVIVDIDRAELNKPTLKPDIPVQADIKSFCEILLTIVNKTSVPDFSAWMTWTKERLLRYPSVLTEFKTSREIHPYYFVKRLTELLGSDSVLVAGNGTACVAAFQAGEVKEGQRMFWNSGCAAMGYDLPASIGASIGLGSKEVICLAGDGSIQMNLQELQTMKQFDLPIKIFYLNNDGYISIKQTQDNFFEGRRVACDRTSGVSFPDFMKIAKAYNLPSASLSTTDDIDNKLEKILKQKGPVLCEVILSNNYMFSPKVSSEKLPDGSMRSKPLEDMFPFLDRNEYNSNLL
jgi:acetolactate synthase I/II/III large subunit